MSTATEQDVARRPDQASQTADAQRRIYQPPADVLETNNGYRVDIDLPGVDAAGLKVEVDRNELKVSGTPSNHFPDAARNVHSEYGIGHYERSFLLPTEIDKDHISANIRHGVVTIHLPKQQPTIKRIPVNAD